MFVKLSRDKTLIKVINTGALCNPLETEIQGQQSSQSAQPSSVFSKAQLIFPSGEPLLQYWLKLNYQQA